MPPYDFTLYWLIKQTGKFTLTVRNHEGIMSSFSFQIFNTCVFDYTLFQRLLQLLCSHTNARAILQKYTIYEGDYLFDIFPAAPKPPATIFIRHIMGISGKVFFFFRHVSVLLRLWNAISPNPQDTGVTAFQWNRSQWNGKSSDIHTHTHTHTFVCIDVPLFYSTLHLSWCEWGVSAGIQTCYGLDVCRFDLHWDMDFSLRQKPPRTALEPTQTPSLCMAGRAVDIRPPTSTEVRTEQSYISTSPSVPSWHFIGRTSQFVWKWI